MDLHKMLADSNADHSFDGENRSTASSDRSADDNNYDDELLDDSDADPNVKSDELSSASSSDASEEEASGENVLIADDNESGKKGKKRIKNEIKWKRNCKKRARNSGQSYVNSKRKTVSGKVLGPPCQCKKKCYDFFTEVEKDKIITQFYGLGEKNLQDAHLSSLIKANKVKRRRNKTSDENPNLLLEPSTSRRTKTKIYKHTYMLKCGTKNVKVCREAFCNIHAISKGRVQRLTEYIGKYASTVTPLDCRGKHHNRPNRINPDIVKTIDDHIQSFPCITSHYTRKDTEKKYLSSELSVKKMYMLYLEKYDTESYRKLKKNEKNVKPKVTYDFYYRHFNSNYNLSFAIPKSDTCGMCDELKIQIDCAKTEAEKMALTAKRDVHLRKAQAFYDRLKEKTDLSRRDNTVEVLCMDYEQNLPFPILPVGDIFYVSQLWVYNQCYHSCSDGEAKMYMYDQTVGKKGANETASFMLHYIKEFLKKEVDTLYVFSDNCAGQNKNMVMVQLFLTLVNNGVLKKIIHHLPERGHSYLPCDRDFSIIEKKKRKKERLYLPEEWYDVVDSCNKFEAVRVTQDMLFNLRDYLQPFFKKSAVYKKRPFTISKYKVFVYDADHPNPVLVSENHNVELEYMDRFNLFKNSASSPNLANNPEIHHLYTSKIPVPEKKYDSIMSIKKFIGQEYLPFYDQMKREGSEMEEEDE